MCHASLTPAVEANPPMAIRTCMVLRDPGQLSSPRSPMIAGRNRDLHGTERSWSTLPTWYRLRGVGGCNPPSSQFSIDPQSRSTPLTIILRESMDRIRVIIRKGCGEWVPALPRNIPNNALCGAKTTCPSSWGGQGAPVSINPSPAQEDYKVMSITIIKR